MRTLAPRLLPAALAACLFFLVLGAKLAVIDRFGSDMPDWDQWDAEAVHLYGPWFGGENFLAHLFEPHNEHRVVLTKLHSLALTLLNGQWDARLESATNALLHAALAAAFWLAGRRWVDGAGGASPLVAAPTRRGARLRDAALFLVVAALFGLPLSRENLLGGFHSQQYWLLATSFVAIALLPFARAWSAAWWAGALAAALALLTMASGPLAAGVVLAVIAFRLWRRELAARDAWPTLAWSASLLAIGVLTRVDVPAHAHMAAKGAHDFVFSLVHSLQWPVPVGFAWWAALVLWAPWALLAWRVIARAQRHSAVGPAFPAVPSGGAPDSRDGTPASGRPTFDPSLAKGTGSSALVIAALGGWVVLQVLATAYARGANGDFPAPRYMDTLAFGLAANALALAWLLARGPRLALLALGGGWLAVLAFGLTGTLRQNFARDFPDERRYYRAAEAHLRAYLATNDPAQLAFDDIPYPSVPALIDRLALPGVRGLMPVSVRPPLALAPMRAPQLAPTADEIFQRNLASQLDLARAPRRGLSPATPPLASHVTFGSFGADGVATKGAWRSAPLAAPLGAWLKIETAGDLGGADNTDEASGRGGELSLTLRDARTDALLATVRPTKVPGDTWRAAYVRAPRGPFVVAAVDRSATRWVAFSAPVEMGALSHAAWVLAKNGALIAFIAAVAAAVGAVASLVVGRGR
ncbi:MAG: hypothetical protein RLZZ15_2728 [Verrucomicrobiota bacterium]|jgi:hypothetical protein